MDKREYRTRSRELRAALLEAQSEMRSASIATVLLFAGVDGAGKSDSVNQLMSWLDPRFVRTRAFDEVTDEERSRPAFWRYWRALPPRGHLGVFLSAWYSQPLLRRAEGASDAWLEEELVRIRALEQTLSEDGHPIAKIWLHLDANAQRQRFQRLEADPLQRWRVTETDWANWERYQDLARAAEELIDGTHTRRCPWHVIDGSDPRARALAVGEALLRTLRSEPPPGRDAGDGTDSSTPSRVRLRAAELEDPPERSRMPRAEYRDELGRLQREVNGLHRRTREASVSLVVVFEGRDASGKGGSIRRVVPAFDARTVDVVRTGPPSDEERAHHYLWRFWRRVPPVGRVALFDRSWYGRVLVERVEGLASREEWSRAYDQINDFERQLAEGGAVVVKFWLHIDGDEQARRFEERRRIALKRWKLTDDDLRNRRLWKKYEKALDDALARTDTELAPWRVVPANDKRVARVEVLRTIRDRLAARLGAAPAVGDVASERDAARSRT